MIRHFASALAVTLLAGAASVSQAQNTALEFNGLTDHVLLTTVTAATELTNNFTVEAWAYPTTSTAPHRILSNHADNFGVSRGWGFGIRDTFWQITTFGVKDYNAPAGSVETGKWTHIAITLDASNTATFYKNGNLLASVANATGARQSTHTLNMGRRPTGNEYWQGRIDEVRVWNTVRTPQQIADNMYGPLTGTEPGLVAYYPLNEGATTATADLSPNNGDGDIVGADWISGATSAGKDSLLYP